jgi:hypothetical protein
LIEHAHDDLPGAQYGWLHSEFARCLAWLVVAGWAARNFDSQNVFAGSGGGEVKILSPERTRDSILTVS